VSGQGSHNGLEQRVDPMGQVALVTGGGRGIGRAIAQALALVGMAVAVTARSADELAETARLIEDAGGRAVAIPGDAADRHMVEHVVRQTEEHLGSVDLLVNNAGTSGPIGLTWESDPEQWWRTLEVNLLGPLLFAHGVLPGMVERRRGRIINIASGAGLGTGRHFSAYASSKAALIRLTEALAVEAGEYGVQVFAVGPGVVKTAMVNDVLESPEQSRLLPGIPNAVNEGRDVPPERVGAMAVLLASGAADGLTGRFLSIFDDLPALIMRAEEIQRDRLHTMRLVS
jgi:NAD(P)-dependent dehydrogenase (short-subunit alcohol dehydrogenase family)